MVIGRIIQGNRCTTFWYVLTANARLKHRVSSWMCIQCAVTDVFCYVVGHVTMTVLSMSRRPLLPTVVLFLMFLRKSHQTYHHLLACVAAGVHFRGVIF